MTTCPVCKANLRLVKVGGRLGRNSGEYQHAVSSIGALAEGESGWRQLNSQDTRARLLMAAAAGGMIMLETATIIANVQWPSWWWCVLHIGTPSTLVIFVRLVWRFL